MNLKGHLITAILYTAATTFLFGIAYPLAMTAIAQAFMPAKANGQLIEHNGKVIGSRIIAQPFTGDGYFHPRPSAAGANGYDATSSGGSNLAATNKKLIDRVEGDVATMQKEHADVEVPIDMVTTSASGLDPDITVANAQFQSERVAKARHITNSEMLQIIAQHISARQLGLLGEPRVNVLEINLALDQLSRNRK